MIFSDNHWWWSDLKFYVVLVRNNYWCGKYLILDELDFGIFSTLIYLLFDIRYTAKYVSLGARPDLVYWYILRTCTYRLNNQLCIRSVSNRHERVRTRKKRAVASPYTLRFLALRNEAHEEIRSAYNKVFDMYYLDERPLDTSMTFPVLEEANRVVGK